MPIYARYKKSDFTPAPEGLWQAVCCDVIDVGIVDSTYNGQTRQIHAVKIRWQLEEVDPKTKKRFSATKRYNNSMSPKATLRKDLETWRGKKFTEAELPKFDLEKLIGANCQLSISHNIKGEGEVYANVMAIVPINPKMKKITVSEDYEREKDRMTSVPGGEGQEWNPDAEAAEQEPENYSPF